MIQGIMGKIQFIEEEVESIEERVVKQAGAG